MLLLMSSLLYTDGRLLPSMYSCDGAIYFLHYCRLIHATEIISWFLCVYCDYFMTSLHSQWLFHCISREYSYILGNYFMLFLHFWQLLYALPAFLATILCPLCISGDFFMLSRHFWRLFHSLHAFLATISWFFSAPGNNKTTKTLLCWRNCAKLCVGSPRRSQELPVAKVTSQWSRLGADYFPKQQIICRFSGLILRMTFRSSKLPDRITKFNY